VRYKTIIVTRSGTEMGEVGLSESWRVSSVANKCDYIACRESRNARVLAPRIWVAPAHPTDCDLSSSHSSGLFPPPRKVWAP